MTYGAFTPHDFAAPSKSRQARTLSLETVLCGSAIVLSAAVGLFLLYGRGVREPQVVVVAAHTIEVAQVAAPAAVVSLRRYGALLDPGFAAHRAPVTFARSVALRTGMEPVRQGSARVQTPTVLGDLRLSTSSPAILNVPVKTAVLEPAPKPVPAPPVKPAAPVKLAAPVAPAPLGEAKVASLESDVPLPLPRPREGLMGTNRPAPGPQSRAPVATPEPQPAEAAAPPPRSSFFDRLFGRAQGMGSALAYASPEDNGIGSSVIGRGTGTAVYEISTHTVHMPDGTKLEAHSGIGPLRDNPSGVTMRMRGATPPNVYQLTMRESLFHGVQALRLTPTGGTTFGRGGLLAHTYMLGPNGDSNGCVVFKNYRAFLAAYETGAVRRLVVVDRLN